MTTDEPPQIEAAFQLLFKEIKVEIDSANKAGGEAFTAGEYVRVDAAREHVQRLNEYSARLAVLRSEWTTLIGVYSTKKPTKPVIEKPAVAERPAVIENTIKHHPLPKTRSDLGRLDRGLRTPEEEFWQPILQVLVQMGGRGRVRKVLHQVEKLMKNRLTKVDYQPVPSDPNMARWYNTAQWARNQLKEEGLLHDDSPHGIWEISEKGRAYLRRQNR